MLCALVPASAHPRGEYLRGHLLAPAIKEDEDRSRPSLLLEEPFEERFFRPKRLQIALSPWSASLKIRPRKSIQTIPGGCAGANMSKRKLHGGRIREGAEKTGIENL
jgi:hypothetical protein